MKKKFSTKWKKSKKQRKQRKFIANAPNHIKHKLLSANLNKSLRKKYQRRNIPLRKEDSVKIMKGEYKGKTGKLELIDPKKQRVSIANINKTKKDGTKIKVWFNPSNLQIQELNLNDKKRISSIERKNNLKIELKENKENASKKK
jgi:large subunit ribosomal protein L24